MVLEKTLQSSLGTKEITPVNSKENQPWIFTGRNVAEAEAPVLWLLDSKSPLSGKGPDAGRRRRQRMRCLDNVTDSVYMNLSKLWKVVEKRGAEVHGVAKSRTWLSDWTTTLCASFELEGKKKKPCKNCHKVALKSNERSSLCSCLYGVRAVGEGGWFTGNV